MLSLSQPLSSPAGPPLRLSPLCLRSAGEGAGDHQILPLPGQARRLGVGAELRHHRAQQPLVAAPLHRQRQLCPHVSALRGARTDARGPAAGTCLSPPLFELPLTSQSPRKLSPPPLPPHPGPKQAGQVC